MATAAAGVGAGVEGSTVQLTTVSTILQRVVIMIERSLHFHGQAARPDDGNKSPPALMFVVLCVVMRPRPVRSL
jgi:hypothetical protein